MSEASGSRDVLGLTAVVVKPLTRVPIRRRESPITISAWRVDVTCDQGAGGIVPIDLTPRETVYRGDGLFLGWPQDRLAEAHRAFTAPSGAAPDREPDLMQLG
jgi:hypothetical protein